MLQRPTFESELDICMKKRYFNTLWGLTQVVGLSAQLLQRGDIPPGRPSLERGRSFLTCMLIKQTAQI